MNTTTNPQKAIEKIYSLTPMQKGILFHSLENDLSRAYVEQLVVDMEGELDIPALQNAYGHVVHRHSSLRTVFVFGEIDKPRQVVLSSIRPDFTEVTLPAGWQGLEQWLDKDIQRGFDLVKGPLSRITILKSGERQYKFVWTFHHIIFDGWCNGIFFSELFGSYSAFRKGSQPDLGPVQPYGRYIQWLERQDLAPALRFWKENIGDYTGQVTFPGHASLPGEFPAAFGEHILRFSEKKTSDIASLCRSYKVTAAGFFQAAWGVLLQYYSNTDDVAFGFVVSGRNPELEGVEEMLGLCINTIPVRVSSLPDQTFGMLLRKVQEQSALQTEYSFVGLSDIQGLTSLQKHLINHVVAFENYPVEKALKELAGGGHGFRTGTVKACEQTNYDLTVVVNPVGDWEIHFRYSTAGFAKEDIERISSHLERLTDAVLADPEILVGKIEVLSGMEKEELLDRFDNSKVSYPEEETIVSIFNGIAGRFPENTAISLNGEAWSYARLNKEAEALAHDLISSGAGRGDIVGLLSERTPDMIIGIMGILKAGCAYLPIDPAYPAERISYMLSDSKTGFVVTQEHLKHLSTGSARKIIIGMFPGTSEAFTGSLPACDPSDLAYIIYTSGSTGLPKGVAIEHRNVVRLLFNGQNLFSFSDKDVWSLFHSYCFDFSVWEIFGALLYGGRLVIVPKETTVDPGEFRRLLVRERITVLNQTPGAFLGLVREEEQNTEPVPALRYVIFGGEALRPATLGSWKRKYPAVKLINMYGITETTVHVTYKEIGRYEIDHNISNIGQPIPTLSVRILDRHGRLMPRGAAGELCVGGAGLARGYLNRPELTAARFVPDPFHSEGRLYRSGDLARYLPGNDMEYLGRIDEQVKIRGFRIELGEIESQLLKCREVKEAVVVARKDEEGQSFLYAYLTGDCELDMTGIREELSKTLPEYMIPSGFMQIDAIPLTRNGKTDRKALPEPALGRSGGKQHIAPRTELEQKIAQAWQEVLKVAEPGVSDNYFAAGGDSIKAIRLVVKINEKTQAGIRIPDIFAYQTIEELASHISRSSSGRDIRKELEQGLSRFSEIKSAILNDPQEAAKLPDSHEDIYPLGSVERGMIYSSLLRPEEPLYYDQFVMRFHIEDISLFERAVGLLVQKHPILRTLYYTRRFREQLKVVLPGISIPLAIEDIRHISPEEQRSLIKAYKEKDILNRFSFDGELLWHMQVFTVAPGDHYLVWSVHHAILDGWSVNVFNSELVSLCDALSRDLSVKPPSLKHSYRDYAAIMHGRQTSSVTADFWRQTLSGYTRNKLPFNITGKRRNSTSGMKSLYRYLDRSLLKGLESVAAGHEVSVKTVCLSAYLYLMKVTSSENDIVSGLVTHDRPEIEDGENILGCFLNTVPVRMDLRNVRSKKELIGKVSAYLRDLKQHELPLSDIALLTGEKTTQGNPVFDCLFNFLDFHVLEGVPGTHTLTFHPDSMRMEDELMEAGEMTNTLFDLEVSTTLGHFFVKVKYAPAFFDKEDMEYALELYTRILSLLADTSDDKINAGALLTSAERESALYTFNDTDTEFPSEKLLHMLFEEKASASPGSIALVQGTEKISYGELNAWANKIARMLLEKGVKSGDPVGLISDRSFSMIAGMLGILKSGAAYVPVDPAYPEERKKYILGNSSVTCVLSDGDYGDLTGVPIADLSISGLSVYEGSDLHIIKDPADLAYTIYTSGSTGNPKGVMIGHRSAVNLVNWVNKTFGVGPEDRLLFVTSMCFDLSVYDIFGMLAAGGQIVIAEKDQIKDVKQLSALMKVHGITFWDSVPTTMSYLVNYLENDEPEFTQHQLRLVFLSGDWIPVALKDRLVRYFPQAEVISLGGATEGTVWSNYYPIKTVKEGQASIPYGKPIDNNRFYILDEDRNPVPRGVAGELYIGGLGVARGYANDPVKSSAAFLPDPFVEGGTMYKTGDLGRLMQDGNMEFLGRLDFQVKIRGFRVELGEIENVLSGHPSVSEAVVTDRSDSHNNRFLCAYVVLKGSLTQGELKEYLSGVLPEYMIPSCFIELDAMPLNTNGKINRKRLPDPDAGLLRKDVQALPSDETEEKLISIWKDLLELQHIGVCDNFFDLGGHSLNATLLLSRIEKHFQIKLPLRELFLFPTIKEIAGYIRKADKSGFSEIEPVPARDFYPVSSAQKRLYILNQLEGAELAYNMPGAMLLEGKTDAAKLEECFRLLIERHESLRTAFGMEEGEIVQRICGEAEFRLEEFEGEEHDIDRIAGSFIRPFDLSRPPLLRAGLVRFSDSRHLLLFDMHHSIADGISMALVVKDFARLYKGLEPAPLKIQYKDYTVWQQKQDAERMHDHEQFWKALFGGELPVLDLPLDYARPAFQQFKGERVGFSVEEKDLPGLGKLLGETGSTLYMFLLACYNVLLSKYSGQDDIITGTPVANRPHADLQDIIGMFANTVALRNRPEPGKSFRIFLEEVKDNSLTAFAHQDYRFENLLEKLDLKRDMSRNPLFDVLFVMQDAPVEELQLPGLVLRPYNLRRSSAKFDLSLEAAGSNGRIDLSFEFSTSLFRREKIEGMAEHLLNIIRSVTERPDQSLSEINLLSTSEREKLLSQFNSPYRRLELPGLLHELVESTVGRMPDKTAILWKGEKISYAQLNSDADRIAGILKGAGAGPETVAGILTTRTPGTVAAILGILKAGGAYLPIDPAYPPERQEYMLRDSRASLLLTDGSASIPTFSGQLIDYTADAGGEYTEMPVSRGLNNLAYIIYTSGSTGQPKGVAIEHAQVCSFIMWAKSTFEEMPFETVYAATSFSFDLSVFEIFYTLYAGKTLRLLDSGAEIDSYTAGDPEILLNTVPSVIADLLDRSVNIENVKVINMAGEPVPGSVKSRLDYNRLIVQNLYGPSECTTYSTFYRMKENSPLQNIGKPLSNTRAYILNSHLQPQPEGVPGEIWLSGEGVARGYIHKEELTRDRFVADPFFGGRMYRTGDMGRWLPDGNIEYMGRRDHQVKVRGYRIELGEIESCMHGFPGVKEELALVRKTASGESYIAAYYVGENVRENDLRDHLAGRLPGYMLPNYLVCLKEFPLNSNGKIDKQRLPEPDHSSGERAYSAPATVIQQKLAAIWQELLGQKRVGAGDNFFALGGHSLKATQMVSRIFRELGAEISLRDVFANPVLEQLAEFVESKEKAGYSVIGPAPVREYYDLSYAQRRLWLISQLNRADVAYNNSGALILNTRMDAELLEKAFLAVIDRHESLRTVFVKIKGEPKQKITASGSFRIELTDLCAAEDKEARMKKIAEETAGTVFDLEKGPLLRVRLARLEEERFMLAFAIHHIISDGWSQEILIREISDIYHGLKSGETYAAEPLRIQYKDYTEWLRGLVNGEAGRKDREYWHEQLSGPLPVLDLPIDHPRPGVKTTNGSMFRFSLDTKTSEGLRNICSASGTSLYMLITAAIKTLLFRYSGQRDIIIGSPVAGRVHSDLENQIGFYVNNLAIRTRLSAEDSFGDLLQNVKQTALNAFRHQLYPFDRLVEELGIERDRSRSPIFDAGFTWQNNSTDAFAGFKERFSASEPQLLPEHRTAKYDLWFFGNESGEGIEMSIEYNTDLFRRESILVMSERLICILRQIGVSTDIQIGALKLSENEDMVPGDRPSFEFSF